MMSSSKTNYMVHHYCG
ncbi:hypothetical protein F383_23719 [Gossypium arboreum]|uniref:Uncharacterized protein n=1 Tax=Gossypium arboreum TaxID=29729 RepID=A0A0B0NUK7_GOSAR|nr:hypothetical protein F383_23719 [Gossypium arboreum]